jgi:hypothetical protein
MEDDSGDRDECPETGPIKLHPLTGSMVNLAGVARNRLLAQAGLGHVECGARSIASGCCL